MKLNSEQIKQIQQIDGVNPKKDAIQDIIIREFVKKVKGILLAYTSFGKAFLLYKLVALFNRQKPDYTILIIVPRTDLKEDIEKHVKKFKFLNVEVAVINSLANRLVKKNTTSYYDLVIADEVHNLAGENSVYFSEVLGHLECKYLLALSATLEKSHLEFLKKYNLEVFFEVPIETGYKLRLLPDYNIYNLPYELTMSEKRDYAEIQKEYLWYISKFSLFDDITPTQCISALLTPQGKTVKYRGEITSAVKLSREIAPFLKKTPGEVIGLAMKWRGCYQRRRLFLNKSRNSIQKTLELIEYIPDQILVFCSSIDIANQMAKIVPDSAAYHSKIAKTKRDKNKEDFFNERIRVLFVIGSMKEGTSYDKLKWVIRQGFTGKALELTQILGRLLRFNSADNSKVASLISVYANDYVWEGKDVSSQQIKWLQNSLKGRNFVTWCNSIHDIKI